MKLIIYHPQGNANAKNTALALLDADMLANYYTSIACFEGSLLHQLAAFSIFSELKKRHLHLKLKPYTRTSPLFEFGRILSVKFKLNKLIKSEVGIFSVQAVTENLDKKVASNIKKSNDSKADGIYAYEDEAWNSFKIGRIKGFQNLYDLPTGYWRAKLKIMKREQVRNPDWLSTITGFYDSETKLNKKDEEIQLADRIFVASNFTKSTLMEYQGVLPPVVVIPYGFPEVNRIKTYDSIQRPIKLLFVGNLSQQKGIADLFKAVNNLGNQVELTLVGKKAVEDCLVLNQEISKHKWIPGLHHNDVLNIMHESDVLVFPSLFDGFGMVMTEAMSQGTPVIATYNSGGPDIIEHGRNGWLFEAGESDVLQEIIEQLIFDKSLIAKAGLAALETARNRPWSVYQQELVNAIKEHFKLVSTPTK